MNVNSSNKADPAPQMFFFCIESGKPDA